MSILIISLFIIMLVYIIITIIALNSLLKLILERFEMENDIDEALKEHICNIYDIIKFNGLVRPIKKENKEAEEK